MDFPPGIPLDHLPGLAPPPGVSPNFVDPVNYHGTIIAVVTVCLIVATIFTTLRLYTKVFLKKSIALEDWALCVAWLGYIAYATLFYMTLRYGNGVHQWDVPVSHLLQFGKLANAVEITYSPLIFIIKSAIFLQYLHVFVTNRKSIRFFLIHLMIWINAIWYTFNIFAVIFQCTPRAKIWNPTLPGHCFVTYYTINFIASTLNVVSDLVMLAMPILWVWKLQMGFKRKIGVSLIFASGIFACLSSILRLVAFLRWGKEKDATWYLTYDGLWTFGELTSGIMCACLPSLPLAFDYFRSKILRVVSTYKADRAENPYGSQSRILRILGFKKSSASHDCFDDQFELKNQDMERYNLQTFPEPKTSAEQRSNTGSRSAISVV